jgi:hypothetical protein
LVGQHDAIPAGSLSPTTGWPKGQVVVDRHPLTLRAGQALGPSYTLAIGIYEAATGQRLPAGDGGGKSLGDTAVLQL